MREEKVATSSDNPQFIVNGFLHSGITAAIDGDEVESVDRPNNSEEIFSDESDGDSSDEDSWLQAHADFYDHFSIHIIIIITLSQVHISSIIMYDTRNSTLLTFNT